MHIKKVLGGLLSGAGIYAVMAACSAGGGGGGEAGGPAGPMASGQPIGSDSSSGGFVDAFLDELVSPVPDAKAGPTAPTPPDIAVETCTASYSQNYTNVSHFAEHAYPGKTVTDLAMVRVVAHLVRPQDMWTGSVPMENQVPATIVIRDGMVAVWCGFAGGGGPAIYDKVTFILPAP
jgi:hypothetical protein